MTPLPLPQGVRSIPGEALRFHVQSRSRPKIWHLVDLEEDGYRGACGCENHEFKRAKAKRENPKERQRCWHVQQALIYFAEVQLRLVAAVQHKLESGYAPNIERGFRKAAAAIASGR